MDSIFALKGSDYVIMVNETTVNHSIFKLRHQFDKSTNLSNNCVAAFAGDHADRANFGSYIRRNIDYSRFRHNRDLTINEIANLIRNQLAEALRKQPYQVNILLGGVDKEGVQLYWIDYLGTLAEVPYGAHGYAGYFISSVLSNFWKPDLDKETALKLVNGAINELRTRFIIAQDNFIVKIVDKNGITQINPDSK